MVTITRRSILVCQVSTTLRRSRRRAVPLALALVHCNVSATAPHTTGGVDGGPDAGSACDPGEVVVLTDYTSTQIALTAPDGTPLSPGFLSTASTTTSGDAFPLSGDVAVPHDRPPSGLVVLLDRYGTNVVTWADPKTAKVLAQLPIGTGFQSNPQDYVEVDATRAYISRWGVNGAPGAQANDGGSDLLIVDRVTPKVLGRIPMPSTGGLPPRPSGMTRVGDQVVVVLQNESADFKTVGDTVLVGIAAGAVAWQVTVTGLKACRVPELSPSGKTLGVSCNGPLDMNGNVTDAAAAAIALFDVTSLPPKPLKQFAISDQLGVGPQDSLAFASDTIVLGRTQTPYGGKGNNELFALDTTTGKATVLLTAHPDSMGNGKGAVYGDVRCGVGCGDVCLMADSDVGKLQRWSIGTGGPTAMPAVTVDTSVGLPPVAIGAY
jgi:hypothetical protein